MFGSFDGSAMIAVGRAQECAADRGDFEITAADVVLAVLSHLDSRTDRRLAALGEALAARPGLDPATPPSAVDPDRLSRLNHSCLADRIPGQRLPFAESAIATFRAAWKKAKWDGRKRVNEYDLLTAAIEQPALDEARRAAGADLDAVRAVINGMRHAG
jgi:hypothetical protein